MKNKKQKINPIQVQKKGHSKRVNLSMHANDDFSHQTRLAKI
jgi:hypothetical protein